MNKAKFITENDTGPDAPWVIICGPSAIGKSHFIKTHGFIVANRWSKRDRAKAGFAGVQINEFTFPSFKLKNLNHHHVAFTSHPKHWSKGWFSKDYIIKKKAIVLGVPYLIWKKRIQQRSVNEQSEKPGWTVTIDKFKNKYIEHFKKLDQKNIPYILVDNRNDYPILDKSSFLTMITEK